MDKHIKDIKIAISPKTAIRRPQGTCLAMLQVHISNDYLEGCRQVWR